MSAEFKGPGGLNAFEFVDVVPDGANVVSARWVFAWKVDKDGNIVKPKAKLVARGFSQAHCCCVWPAPAWGGLRSI